MSKKIVGPPRFDHIQVMRLEIDRGQTQDSVVAVVAYVNARTREMFGSVSLTSGHLSKTTKERLAELYASVERDALSVIFESGDEAPQEETHDRPRGIVEPEEDSAQI